MADEAARRKLESRRDLALATIVLGVDQSQLYLLGEPTDPVEVWRKLQNTFQKKSWANKFRLKKKLFNMKLENGQNLQDHLKRYNWVYIIKNKSDVFGVFTEFKALVENHYDHKIKILRTDNGGEYVSTDCERFLKVSGIVHQKTVPKTLEQNGVAERMNRTILEAVRAMLSDSKLPKTFWAEAVSTAVYVKNRNPTSAHKDLTPYQALNMLLVNASRICRRQQPSKSTSQLQNSTAHIAASISMKRMDSLMHSPQPEDGERSRKHVAKPLFGFDYC
ncbi:Integrase catalytic core [Trinorchestia longiramus]|nr:Integrase catalytic core [Trinorchestia longiramus]